MQANSLCTARCTTRRLPHGGGGHLRPDGNPAGGAGVDPTGVAREAAGEGTTPWREDEAAWR